MSLYALTKHKQRNQYVIETQQLLKQLNNSIIKLFWVPAHTGIIGNEEADLAAKEATQLPETNNIKLPQSHVKNLVKHEIMLQWQEEWDTTDKSRYTYTFFPRVNTQRTLGQSQLTQYFTGHGQFLTFVHRLGKATTPDCICGEEGNPSHYLFHCPLTSAHHLNKPLDTHIPAWSDNVMRNKTAQNKIINIIKKLEVIKPTAIDPDNS